ncbi:MAG: LLM class F420-dependent oxidoreductase [Candidatus Dormibacteraeota bacterium]|nr:LLM class F420-dependent oxidoreductase [Candidatus Dormibacteraeota bacterium]
MKFGIAIFPTDQSIAVGELVREVEDRGFESFWVPEHTHIPVSRRTPYPAGGDLPEYYKRTLDPLVALTIAAQNSSRLLLGFGIVLVVERDPITTAKAVASLDLVSNGRVLFGIGGGWNREEMENHGTDPKLRWRLLRERVLAMREIWTREEAEFHGDFVDFDPIWSWPKPLQSPLPVLVGGNTENSMKRVIEYGDGWIPNAGRSRLISQVPVFRRLCDESGRGHLPLTVYGTRPSPEAIAEYESLGVDRLVFWMPSRPRDDVLRELEIVAGLLAK